MSGIHLCAYPGCTTSPVDGRLCCPAHWEMLPDSLRKSINGAHRAKDWPGHRLYVLEAKRWLAEQARLKAARRQAPGAGAAGQGCVTGTAGVAP